MPLTLLAQKKKFATSDSAIPLAVTDTPNNYPQILGINIGEPSPAYDFKKQDPVLMGAKELSEIGAKMIKIKLPAAEKMNEILSQSFTHYFFEINEEVGSAPKTDAEKQKVFNKFYALAKNLLTRRDTGGKTIFLGYRSLDEGPELSYLDNDQERSLKISIFIENINLLTSAIEAARSEVNYSRCLVYSYLTVSRVTEAMQTKKIFTVNGILPKVKTDFVAYTAAEIQENSASEIKKTLDYISFNISPKSNFNAPRIWISECGLSWETCDSDSQIHLQNNQKIIKKFIQSGVPYVFIKQLYAGQTGNYRLIDNKFKQSPLFISLKDFYSNQLKAAEELKQRSGRYPTLKEMADYSASLL